MTSLEWGSCAGEQIPQTGELLSDRNGDGVLREENRMLPLLTIAHMQMDCGWLKDCTRPNLTHSTPSALAGWSVDEPALISLDNPPAN